MISWWDVDKGVGREVDFFVGYGWVTMLYSV